MSRLKLDENLSRKLKPILTELHHDVCTAADEGLLSRPDSEVAAAAKREARILLTLDVAFGDLRRYAPGSHPGIILFRPASLGPMTVNRVVEAFVKSTDVASLAGCVAIVEQNQVRVRRHPI